MTGAWQWPPLLPSEQTVHVAKSALLCLTGMAALLPLVTMALLQEDLDAYLLGPVRVDD